MSYASIMVHAEADDVCDCRLALAADLAQKFDARLIGVAAEAFDPPNYASAYANIAGEILLAENEAVSDRLKQAEARFRGRVGAVPKSVDWRSNTGLPRDVLALEARSADLLVVGFRRAESFGLHDRLNPADLVVQAGRPVLVTPSHLEALVAPSVVVAWKDSREARRALKDAMPFLKQARHVTVAEVVETQALHAEVPRSLEDVAAYLASHRVSASTLSQVAKPEFAAEVILDIADAENAGLIVAGAYSHSRLGERLFGGVTAELLEQAIMPVLLSH